MTTRATKKISNATVETFVVKAASAVTKGMPVTLDSEGIVLDSVAGDRAIGIALESATAGNRVQVLMFGPIVPMKVGTAGVTAGKYVEVGTTGVIDRTLGGGTVVRYIVGIALETGVSADIVGVVALSFAGGTA